MKSLILTLCLGLLFSVASTNSYSSVVEKGVSISVLQDDAYTAVPNVYADVGQLIMVATVEVEDLSYKVKQVHIGYLPFISNEWNPDVLPRPPTNRYVKN